MTVSDLFAGAMLPGLTLVGLYALYVLWKLRTKSDAPIDAGVVAERGPRISLAEIGSGILPTLALIISVLGSILLGIATPTEAAGVGVGGAILVAAAQISPAMKRQALGTVGLALALLAAGRRRLGEGGFQRRCPDRHARHASLPAASSC